MFLWTLVMLFAAFTSAMVVRKAGGDWRGLDLPAILWINTGVIIASSITLEYGRRRMTSPRGGIAGVGLAGLLGLGFLAGQMAAWRELVRAGIYLPTSPDAAFFYLLTGVHGLHVIAALAVLGWLFASLVRNAREAEQPFFAGVAAAFWHFLTGTWIYLFILLWVI